MHAWGGKQLLLDIDTTRPLTAGSINMKADRRKKKSIRSSDIISSRERPKTATGISSNIHRNKVWSPKKRVDADTQQIFRYTNSLDALHKKHCNEKVLEVPTPIVVRSVKPVTTTKEGRALAERSEKKVQPDVEKKVLRYCKALRSYSGLSSEIKYLSSTLQVSSDDDTHFVIN